MITVVMMMMMMMVMVMLMSTNGVDGLTDAGISQ